MELKTNLDCNTTWLFIYSHMQSFFHNFVDIYLQDIQRVKTHIHNSFSTNTLLLFVIFWDLK